MKQKQKIALAVAALALAFLWSGGAKADSWTQKYIVDKATSAGVCPMEGVQDIHGHNWIGDSGDVILYEYTGESWINHSDEVKNLIGYEEGDKITTVYADKSGNIWVSTNRGKMVMYDGSNWSWVSPVAVWTQVYGYSVPEGSLGSFNEVFGDSQGNVYVSASIDCNVCGNGGQDTQILKRSTNGVWSTAIPNGGVVSRSNANKLKGTFDNSTGDFWFFLYWGDSSGVYRYRNDAWTNYTTADGLADNTVSDILVDSTGKVWVNSENGNIATSKGISKFDGVSWVIWNADTGNLASSVITQISEDNRGRVWFTTHGDGGGIASIYDTADGSWMYYSGKNAEDEFDHVLRVFFFGSEVWVSTFTLSDGFTILENNDSYSTIYGQAGGTVVEKTIVGQLEELKKAKVKTRKVTISRRTQVKKKWKWKKAYCGKTSSGWYKALNLPIGTYKVQIQGLKTKAVNITNGDPYRLNF